LSVVVGGGGGGVGLVSLDSLSHCGFAQLFCYSTLFVVGASGVALGP
jgi:hypothetical protein